MESLYIEPGYVQRLLQSVSFSRNVPIAYMNIGRFVDIDIIDSRDREDVEHFRSILAGDDLNGDSRRYISIVTAASTWSDDKLLDLMRFLLESKLVDDSMMLIGCRLYSEREPGKSEQRRTSAALIDDICELVELGDVSIAYSDNIFFTEQASVKCLSFDRSIFDLLAQKYTVKCEDLSWEQIKAVEGVAESLQAVSVWRAMNGRKNGEIEIPTRMQLEEYLDALGTVLPERTLSEIGEYDADDVLDGIASPYKFIEMLQYDANGISMEPPETGWSAAVDAMEIWKMVVPNGEDRRYGCSLQPGALSSPALFEHEMDRLRSVSDELGIRPLVVAKTKYGISFGDLGLERNAFTRLR